MLFLGGLFLFGLLLSFQELVDASGGVEHLLLPGVEWVAGAADFHVLFFFGRTGDDHVLAGTDDLGLWEIGRMSIFFHNKRLSGNSFNL